VIASEVGGLAYVVRDGYNGFLVPRRDAEALAGRILSLLHDSTLRTRLSAQAQEYAHGYDWHAIAAAMLRQYDELATPVTMWA
jgi:D-inositol-3-phosphate glycosyltransferase